MEKEYIRSLCFVLAKAVHDLFPEGKLYMEHALSKGYYCKLVCEAELTATDVKQIKQRMLEIIAKDLPFVQHEAPAPEVIALFRRNKREDKALLLETLQEPTATYYTLDGYVDDFYLPLLPSTGGIYLFDIEKYQKGLLLRVPSPTHPDELEPYVNQRKMLNVFQDLRQHQQAIGMSNVGELNRGIEQRDIATVVQVAETLQEKYIGKIADEIYKKYEKGVRVVLISGPSSSGKTTFCKRLQLQLRANTLRPIGISLDDYYVNRIDTPLDTNGEYDFESFYAIDLQQFNADLKDLLAGKAVHLPSYNFPKGERVYKGNTAQLGDRSIVVMEGIHGMNPALVAELAPETIFKIYVSALTAISLDDHNWIASTDNRLIRRMVRDYQFRGSTAKDTLARWASVRRGEDKWIFPYQENSDAMFNSALLYELAALRPTAEKVLQEVNPDDAEYPEAQRLLNLLHYFHPVDTASLPNTSLIREFLGGSSFKY
ncbi:uridine kinase [Bacteroidia bacterium]|nr:uridine kinase [Bacteroidia bacterium]